MVLELINSSMLSCFLAHAFCETQIFNAVLMLGGFMLDLFQKALYNIFVVGLTSIVFFGGIYLLYSGMNKDNQGYMISGAILIAGGLLNYFKIIEIQEIEKNHQIDKDEK